MLDGMLTAFILGGGFLNYVRGNTDIPQGLTRPLVSGYLLIPFIPVETWEAGVGLLASFLTLWVFGFAMGWGAYFSYKPHQEKEVAWIDWVLRKLGINPLFEHEKYNLVGMSLRGLHFTVPVVIWLTISTDFDLYAYALTGLLMGPIYSFMRLKTRYVVPGAEFVSGMYFSAVFWGMA